MSNGSRQQLFFTRIKLTNWRNFKSVEVYLRRRAIFVGPNASGKSNLLDVFRFLRDIVSVGGGLQAAVRKRGNVIGVRCLFARRPSFVEIEVDIGDESDLNLWTYRLRFNKDGKKDRPIIEAEEVLQSGTNTPIASRPTNEDREDTERLTQTLLEQTNENREFRDIADFFQQIRYLHLVPQIVRDSRRHIFDEEDPYGGDLLRRMNQTSPRSRAARLQHMGKALRIAVPQFEDITLEHDAEGKPHLEAKFRHWRVNPTRQREETFSDGTLRLVGLLWSISERGGPLLLEEPELSLNEEIVRSLSVLIARMQRRSGRQVLLTTHSNALLAPEGVGLDEVHLLIPSDDGTRIQTAGDDREIRTLVQNGLTVGEAVLPRAKPAEISQLSLFDAAPR